MPYPIVRRIALPALAATVLLPCGAAGAHAATAPQEVNLEEVVNTLHENGGLYIHPGAGDLSDAQVDMLRAPLERANLPVYLAIFPEGTVPARTTAHNRLILDIYQGVRRKGTYAVAIGDQVRAYSWALSPQTTVKVWQDAKKTGGGNLVRRLSAFAAGAGTATPGDPGPGPAVGSEKPVAVKPPEPEVTHDPQAIDQEPSGGPSTALLAGGGAAVALAIGGGAFLLYRRRGQRRPAPASGQTPPAASGHPPTGSGPAGQGPGPQGTDAPPPADTR